MDNTPRTCASDPADECDDSQAQHHEETLIELHTKVEAWFKRALELGIHRDEPGHELKISVFNSDSCSHDGDVELLGVVVTSTFNEVL